MDVTAVVAAAAVEAAPRILEFLFLIDSSTDQQLTCSKILASDGEIWNDKD